jgi:hypothetical protein
MPLLYVNNNILQANTAIRKRNPISHLLRDFKKANINIVISVNDNRHTAIVK